MATRYWVGGSGTWNTSTTNWSTSSGGSGGASTPGASDTVIFDANSGLTSGEVVYIGSGRSVTTVKLQYGTLDTQNNNFTATTILVYGTGTKGLILGSSTISCQNWYITNTTNFTLNAGTSTIDNSTRNFIGGGLVYNNVYIQGSVGSSIGRTVLLGGSNTFANLNINYYVHASNETPCEILIESGSTQTVTGTFTANSQVLCRPIVRTGKSFSINENTLARDFTRSAGESAQIVAAIASLSYFDFMDIVGAGAATWSGTRLGDALGNTGITFDAPVTRYWVGGTGYFQQTTHWSTSPGGASGASYPICHDAAIFDASSFSGAGQSVTTNQSGTSGMICFPQMTWTDATNNPRLNVDGLTTDVNALYFFGSQLWNCTMTVSAYLENIAFAARTDEVWDVTNVTWHTSGYTDFYIDMPGGSLTLGSDFDFSNVVGSDSDTIYLCHGGFYDDGFNVNIDYFNASVMPGEIRSFTIDGAWTLTGALSYTTYGVAAWDTSDQTNLTYSISGTITFEHLETAKKIVINGGGVQFSDVVLKGFNTTSDFLILGNNYFQSLSVTLPADVIEIEAGTTQEITTLTIEGSSTNQLTLKSYSSGSRATINASVGTFKYLSVKDIAADGTVPFQLCLGGIDLGNNQNWDFACMPTFDTSLITAVSRVQQNIPFPQFVIGGRGGASGTTYALFKKSTTYGFHVWRSEVYKIAKDFDIVEINFKVIPSLATNMRLIPVLYFDNETTVVPGNEINSINYTNSESFITLTAKNFTNSVHGNHSFFFELQSRGTVLATVALPITIEIEVNDN